MLGFQFNTPPPPPPVHGLTPYLYSSGNIYSSQTTSGLLKCPTPPPAKSQSLNRKHSMELSQVGLLSPASLSPMGSTQSKQSRVQRTRVRTNCMGVLCARLSQASKILQIWRKKIADKFCQLAVTWFQSLRNMNEPQGRI